MSVKVLVKHCSPTLAGLKTGSLFSIKRKKRSELYQDLRKLNQILTKKGLRAIPMRYGENRILIYLYRPSYLLRDLRCPAVAEILREKGYAVDNAQTCVAQLAKNLKQEGEFPHEIGLFLGYPPSDVKGFMRSPRNGVKCTGCWKVYGDKEEAERTFLRYKRCTEQYCREVKKGRTLEQLLVQTAPEKSN